MLPYTPTKQNPGVELDSVENKEMEKGPSSLSVFEASLINGISNVVRERESAALAAHCKNPLLF